MNQDEPNVSASEPRDIISTELIGLMGFIVVVFVWAAYGLWQEASNTDRSFDRLNTLFSGLAFWGLVLAIFLQKRELELQRYELAKTREQIQGQKEQLESQALTLKQQRFESTFFSLLDLFIGVIGSMEVTVTGEGRPIVFKGRECFTRLYYDFQREYQNIQHTTQSADHKALCIAAYDAFADHKQVVIGHYFRTFYNIVKFIDKSPIEDKQTYINILRAQLSSSELNLLFYNCVSNYGSHKFKPYVEQFGLLENMTLSNLIRQDHKDLYKESAFKSQL